MLPLTGNQLTAIEPVYIEAEQTKIPTLARIVLAQLLSDDRKDRVDEEPQGCEGSPDWSVASPEHFIR